MITHLMGLMDRLDDTVPLAARPYGLLPARARRLDSDVQCGEQPGDRRKPPGRRMNRSGS